MPAVAGHRACHGEWLIQAEFPDYTLQVIMDTDFSEE